MANWCASADILNSTFSLITSVETSVENSAGYVF